MVSLTELLNGTPTLDDQAALIVDDRILTSCAAVRARMDGWWTFAVGNTFLITPSLHKGRPSMS
jgi:hypothetical protein